MEDSMKVIVVHPAQQHSFKTAEAFKEHGILDKYITTVYLKNNSLTLKILKFLKGDNLKRAKSRKSNLLEDSEIVQFGELYNLLILFLSRIEKKSYISNIIKKIMLNRFNSKVFKYIKKHNINVVISYDTLSLSLYKKLDHHLPQVIKVLDMSAPSINYMNLLLKDDIKKYDGDSNFLRKEIESKKYNKDIIDSEEEIFRADYFLVASHFTKKSLLYNQINEKKIHKAKYGIDINNYNRRSKNKPDEIVFSFVGRVTQNKGAWYFIDAVRALNEILPIIYPNIKVRFLIAGHYNKKDTNIINAPNNCEFLGHLTRDKMYDFYSQTDILIFPSISDGFGLSVLESLASGIPVICATTAGISEEIRDYYNGFIISPHKHNEILEKMIWFIENSHKIKEMSLNSMKTAQKLTWDKYNSSIGSFIEILKERLNEK
ncbi:glycosyltransferase [Psychrobacillus glaciei]|uniref:Glycosyltransferase n=1 Tax=Psychrobacillus glaciei TaxID=2283160 RepID=A0A5J6SMM7_9BACI|nr:glycosyltransferase family 4 protein [Psychrobacillus glaciei]QFF98024.1 glycosyltransferase [Psychrobacillus glaciei]